MRRISGRELGRSLCVITALFLTSCKLPPAPVHQAQFVPPPPTKPAGRMPVCAHPEEIDASRIIGLQTQLMQIALSCGGDDKYDGFVRKFQPQLEKQRDVLAAFFARAYGHGRSRSAYDEYVTQLADAESTYNLASGVDFCTLSKATLDQAPSLSSGDDLASFVAKVPVQQPTEFQACGTSGARPAILKTGRTRQVRHSKKKYHHKAG
jgi:hypothetical protein